MEPAACVGTPAALAPLRHAPCAPMARAFWVRGRCLPGALSGFRRLRVPDASCPAPALHACLSGLVEHLRSPSCRMLHSHASRPCPQVAPARRRRLHARGLACHLSSLLAPSMRACFTRACATIRGGSDPWDLKGRSCLGAACTAASCSLPRCLATSLSVRRGGLGLAPSSRFLGRFCLQLAVPSAGRYRRLHTYGLSRARK